MSERKELVKVDMAQYGLTEEKAKAVRQTFDAVLAGAEELERQYNEIIAKPISPELASEAKALRLKYVKVRTGIAAVHKEQKAFYLSGGRAVDGLKNAYTHAVIGNEEKLKEIEEHYERIEQERLNALQLARAEKLSQYVDDANERDLKRLADDEFDALLAAKKQQHEDRLEAERKAEQERIESARKEAEERERIRKENEQLKKEAEAREKAEAERIAREKAEREKERAEAERKAKALQQKLDAEKKAREKAEAEQAKAASEKAAAEKAERERVKKMMAAPDKEKLLAFADTVAGLVVPDVGVDSARDIARGIATMQSKMVSWIKQEAGKL